MKIQWWFLVLGSALSVSIAGCGEEAVEEGDDDTEMSGDDDDTTPVAPEPSLDGEVPADYESNYNLVTDARSLSESHQGMWVEIFVNDTGMTVWDAGTGTFPAGTIIVKENYADETAEDVMAWTIMEKVASGYDPDHNDWHWVKVTADGTVAANGIEDGCIGCHSAGDDYVLYER